MKMNRKQLAQWMQEQPPQAEIFCRDDWTEQQRAAVFAKVQADRAAYDELYKALETADFSLAGISMECAIENVGPTWNDHQIGFWQEMTRALASAAGQIWEGERRNVNTETGRPIY